MTTDKPGDSTPSTSTPGTSSDLSADAVAWLGRFAEALGLPAPTESEVVELLALAGVAARASHRQAAPVACWLAAMAGISPSIALAKAQTVT